MGPEGAFRMVLVGGLEGGLEVGLEGAFKMVLLGGLDEGLEGWLEKGWREGCAFLPIEQGLPLGRSHVPVLVLIVQLLGRHPGLALDVTLAWPWRSLWLSHCFAA